MREKNKNASLEVDLTRFCREFREFFFSFIIADKKSAKFLHSVVFTENDDSTFKD